MAFQDTWTQCWKYFGGLFDSETCNVDEGCIHVYCSLYLDMQMSLGEKGHL